MIDSAEQYIIIFSQTKWRSFNVLMSIYFTFHNFIEQDNLQVRMDFTSMHSFSGSGVPFDIKTNTGEILPSQPLDREENASYYFRVQVSAIISFSSFMSFMSNVLINSEYVLVTFILRLHSKICIL